MLELAEGTPPKAETTGFTLLEALKPLAAELNATSGVGGRIYDGNRFGVALEWNCCPLSDELKE